MRFFCGWTAAAFVAGLLAAGCSSSEQDDNNNNVVDGELTWPEVEVSDEDAPKAKSVPDQAEWSTVSLPLEIEGKDSGKEGILYSVMLSHYWLVANQQPDGAYLYDWNAETGESTKEFSRLRLLATAWSQAVVYRFLPRKAFLLAAYRVVNKYTGDLRRVEDDSGDMMAHLSGSLNETVFMFLAMVELEGVLNSGEFDEPIAEMTRFMAHQFDPETGCIWTKLDHGGSCADQHSHFAVGQGMVAYERLYAETGDSRWLDMLEKSVSYYHDYFNTEGRDTNDPYWLAWAAAPMVSLCIERPNADAEEWIFAMADFRAGDQYLAGDATYVGGFKKRSGRPPTWSAVSYVEGILDAYRLAVAREDAARMKRYRQAGILAARYLMSLQYRADNVDSWDLIDAERAIGAYHFSNHANASSIDMHYVRVDYPDHFAITLLKTLSYLELPETFPGTGLALTWSKEE